LSDFLDWNWYLDTPDGGGRFNQSPIWNPDHGFGGNGIPTNKTALFDGAPFPRGTGGGCVTDGPFKDTQFRIGPLGKMEKNKSHCLTRDINAAEVEANGGLSKIQKTLKAKSFKDFMDNVQKSLEGFPPGGPGGHGGHGGSGAAKGPGGFPMFPPGFKIESDLHVIAHGAIGGEASPRIRTTQALANGYTDVGSLELIE